MKKRVAVLIAALCGLLLVGASFAQETPDDEMPGGARESSPSAALYRRLGSVGLDPAQIYRIREASLDREDLHISLQSGIIAFTRAIDGHITGAFFEGDGELLLSPPDRVERWSLSQFTNAAILEERFTSAYLRFNDNTFADLQPYLRSLLAPVILPDPDPEPEAEHPEPHGSGLPETAPEFVAKWDKASQALAQMGALRLLTTFINAETIAPDGSRRWKQPLNDRYLAARVASVRLGIFDLYFDTLAPEHILVAQSKVEDGESHYDVWTSFPMRSARSRVQASASVQTLAAAELFTEPVHIPRYTIRARILPSRELQADTTMELNVTEPGHRILLFELSRFLQVSAVTVEGRPVEFVQNEALEGSDLARRGNDVIAVVFPRPIAPNTPVRVRFVYSGEVLSDAGNGLMYVGARGIWYPNRGLAMSDFDIEFRYPAEWTLVATGKRQSTTPTAAPPQEQTPGAVNEQVAHYVSERPIPVAGFNLGRYLQTSANAGPVVVEIYAARGVETSFPRQETVVAGQGRDPFTGQKTPTLNSAPTLQPSPSQQLRPLADETAWTIEYLSARLGPFPYSTLALAQMPGPISQSWPGLVYLSSMAFLSPQDRQRAQLSPFEDLLYGRLMAPHETAHQWWGDLMIWRSYREQWLIEALSNYSVLRMIEQQDPAAFRAIMEQYRLDLLALTRSGSPLGDAGPVTLGIRLESSRFPAAYSVVAYGRGTWLLHMLRFLLSDPGPEALPKRTARASKKLPPDPAAGNDPFFTVLRGLRQKFEGKEITTRDVQQAFEAALPASRRFEGRKSLEWFFDNWVNGTEIPQLALTDTKLVSASGAVTATGRIVQSHVPQHFVTSIPVYAETGDSIPWLLGRVFVDGVATEFRFTAPKGTRKLLLDPYSTVLKRP